MHQIKKYPIKFKEIEIIAKKGNKFFLKSFYTQDNQGNLTGQENYFIDLANAVYRSKPRIRDRARAWKFIFKYFFFAKELFNKIEQNPQKEIYVLDIGCSKGYFRKVLENNVKEGEKVIYFGVDLREDVLKEAIWGNSIDAGASGDKIDSIYIWHDATEKFPLKSNSFDFIICSQLIKYLEKDKVDYLISEIYRLLKKDGVLFLSNGLMLNTKADLSFVLNFINPNQLERIQKRKEVLWTTQELLEIFKKNRFNKVEVYGGEANLRKLMRRAEDEDRVLINKLRRILPDEIVESIFGFLYPRESGVKIFVIKK